MAVERRQELLHELIAVCDHLHVVLQYETDKLSAAAILRVSCAWNDLAEIIEELEEEGYARGE